MRPGIRLLPGWFERKECRMCGSDIQRKPKYSYTSPLSEVKLTVCKKCAIREYYGTSGSNSKLYKKDVSNKKLFGVNIDE
jgi:ribosome-binding protein aMBF1 (putative translation factor)|tara:strand:+ start:4764 stop:5003 length:240 start_codon:yes stop_codon:yes gene_type:complete